MSAFSRRDFLRLANRTLLVASSALGLGAILRFLGYQTGSNGPATVDIGLAADYPLGSRTQLPDIPAILIHDENGFSALSLTCTHLGCTTKQGEDGFTCPCHGSRFGENGEVLHGPAKEPLDKLHVEISTDGRLLLDKGALTDS